MEYTRYIKSTAQGFNAIVERVKFYVEGSWQAEGRYKEVLLIDYLRRILPDFVSAAAGFVVDIGSRCPIDIIIFDNRLPNVYQYGDFVIVPAGAVYGIVHVYNKLMEGNMEGIIEKAHKEGQIVGPSVFNGIFTYEQEIDIKDTIPQNLRTTLMQSSGYVNAICCGPDYFLKYWDAGNSTGRCYALYNTSGLAFGYYITNLLETISILSHKNVVDEHKNRFIFNAKDHDAYGFNYDKLDI